MGPFQLYFGSRTDLVARVATPFKKPKDIYKTCVWGDFQTFDCFNGRETIAEASYALISAKITMICDNIIYIRGTLSVPHK